MTTESLAHGALLLTGALLTLLMGLGLSLQVRWRRDLARWPHHALFFIVCVGTLLAALVIGQAGGRWWALLPAFLLLLSMARTRPGRADHWQRALACALVYGLGAWGAW